MSLEELAAAVARTEERARSNTKRLNEMEEDHRALNRLATAVEVMASRQVSMGESLDRLTEKVDALEAEPAKKWRFVVEKILYFLLAAVVGFFLAEMGL